MTDPIFYRDSQGVIHPCDAADTGDGRVTPIHALPQEQLDALSNGGGAPDESASYNVGASTGSVQLFPENSSRQGGSIFNNSPGTLYVRIGEEASLTDWSFAVLPGGYWEMPHRWTGRPIYGIWNSTTGEAHITDLFTEAW